MKPKMQPWLAGIVSVACMLVATSTQASVLGFDGGEGTTAVDQYTGIAGDEWLEGWIAQIQDGINASVVNTTPVVAGGGNFLLLSDVEGSEGVTRRFSMPTDSAYTLSLDLRVDSVPDSGGTINLSTGSGRSVNTDSTNFVQAIASVGGNWSFRDGIVDVNSTVHSDIALTEGGVYHFQFDVDPVAKSYAVSLSDGTDTFNSETIYFRNQTDTASASTAYFELGAQYGSGAYGFSLDNVSLVPEPSTLILAALALLGLAFCGRRRKR